MVLNPQGSMAYDRADGEIKWIKQIPITFIDHKYNIGLSKHGTALDLNTGETKWKSPIRNAGNRTEVFYLNKDAVLINAGGIKRINLQDGTGWEYKAKTHASKVDAGSVVAGVLLGTATALATGVAVIPGNTTDEIDKLCSNIFYDGSQIYYASRKEIVCLEENGIEKWAIQFEDKKTSSSRIWGEGNILYMLNYGYGYLSGTDRSIRIGEAYIAAFNKKDGQQLYKHSIDINAFVVSHSLLADTLWVHSGEKVTKYNLASGQKIADRILIRTPLEEHVHFLDGDEYFVTITDSYQSLSQAYPGERFLSGRQSIIRIDKKLQPLHTVEGDIWLLRSKYKDYYILESLTQTTIVKDGKAIATIDLTGANIFEDLLVSAYADKLTIINMNDLLK